MKLGDNVIVNFFYDIDNNTLYESSVTINYKNFSKIIGARILAHIAYDYASGFIYVVHGDTEHVKKSISKLIFKKYVIKNIIFGSPYSTIRIRDSGEFKRASLIISSQLGLVENIRVIEANFSKMPSLREKLKIDGYFKYFRDINIDIYEEYYSNGTKRKSPKKICNIEGSCVFISMSSATTPSDKEWSVASALYANKMKNYDGDIFLDLYSIKMKIDMGFTIEEICSIFIGEMDLDFSELMRAITLIGKSYDNLEYDFYYIFDTDGVNFEIRDGALGKNFQLLGHSPDKGRAMIRSFAMISPKNFKKAFGVEKTPLIFKLDKSCNKILIKSDDYSFSYHQSYFNSMKKYFENFDVEKSQRSRSNSSCNPMFFTVRSLKTYPNVFRFIKQMCKEEGFPFIDLPVLIGPIERIFGSGTQGGFISERQFLEKNDKLPLEIDKFNKIMPPFIAINSITKPDYADHNSTLIHEYRHFIFSRVNPNYKHKYNSSENKNLIRNNPDKYWDIYLSDPDERQAHIYQIKYELSIGKSIDEIIRDKVGGEINLKNYKIAILYKDIVKASIDEQEDLDESG